MRDKGNKVGALLDHPDAECSTGPASLARENEAGGSWGQLVYILHVNI